MISWILNLLCVLVVAISTAFANMPLGMAQTETQPSATVTETQPSSSITETAPPVKDTAKESNSAPTETAPAVKDTVKESSPTTTQTAPAVKDTVKESSPTTTETAPAVKDTAKEPNSTTTETDPAAEEKEFKAKVNDLAKKAFEATINDKFADAENYWTQLIELMPNNPAVWSNRGNSKASLAKYEEAIADYNKAMELAPDAPDPYLNRGLVWEKLGKFEAALADYNRLLEISPNDALGYNSRGNIYGQLGDWEKAIADYKKATELDPFYPFASANYALALYQTGKTEVAIRTMRNIIRRYPQFADMRAALTAVLWVQGQYGEAESNWVAAVGLDPRYKEIDWVKNERRWPPLMVQALDKFLKIE